MAVFHATQRPAGLQVTQCLEFCYDPSPVPYHHHLRRDGALEFTVYPNDGKGWPRTREEMDRCADAIARDFVQALLATGPEMMAG